MPISQTKTIAPFPSWQKNDLNTPIERYETLPDPCRMRNKTLFGLPLRSVFTNQEISDETLQLYINEAISEVEHVLDLYITPTQFHEKHDYNREMFSYSFAYLKLNHPNILQVQAVKISFNNDTFLDAQVTFPLEHVHVMPQEGTIQLVPAFGTSLSGFLMSAFSGVQYHAFQAAFMNNWPGAVRVEYTAGFEKDKVPALLSALIENIAAKMFLSTLGPILFPFTGTSVGIDGTAQSVSTLGPGFLAQRIAELQSTIDKQSEAAKGYYSRKFLVDSM